MSRLYKGFPIPQDGFPIKVATRRVLDALQETIEHLPLPVLYPYADALTDTSSGEVPVRKTKRNVLIDHSGG